MKLFRSQGRKTVLAYLFTGFLLSPVVLPAQTITIAPGSQFSLGSGSLDAGCGDLAVAGTFSVNSGSANSLRNVTINPGVLNGGSGSINLSGDWVNQGTFNPQTGSVNISDGCGTTSSRLVGDSTFNRLSVSSSSGKQLQPESGSTQTFSGGLAFSLCVSL